MPCVTVNEADEIEGMIQQALCLILPPLLRAVDVRWHAPAAARL